MDPNPLIGRPLRRREDPRLLAGAGRYVADLRIPGALHLAFVRSPHAHARVVRVDVAAARALPGVTAVLTAAELDARPIAVAFDGEGYHGADWPPLARDRVRFVGDPVVVVAARDRYVAEDAADLVEVTYEPLPAVASVEAARAPEAPAVHEAVPGNTYYRLDHRHGDVEAAFAAAAVVVRGTFRHQRLAASPLEGRGIAVEPAGGRLRVWASTQTPHLLRTALARSLGMAEDAVRVSVPDVGGGFGPKMHAYPEDVVASAVARALGRPVVWIEDRRENLLAMAQAREQVVEAELAADRDGRILGLRASVASDAGAYSIYPLTAILEALGTAQIMPGPYRVPAYAYATVAVATHKAPMGAYRGVGMTVGVLVMERLVDKLAAALGLDPAEVRRRNFVAPDAFPHTAPTGLVYDSGRFAQTLAAALGALGYDEARRAQAEARAAGRLVGIGLAAFVEYTGMGPRTFARRGMADVPGRDSATVTVDASGVAHVAVSCPSQGQGLETLYAQLAAGELGMDPEAVRVEPVDTDAVPPGSGTFASRAAVSGGGAVVRAAGEVRARAAEVAARLLEAASGDVTAAGGRFFVRGAPERGVSWGEVARVAAQEASARGHGGRASAPGGAGGRREGAGSDGGAGGLAAAATYEPPPAAFSNGAHAAVVEVDRDTGLVRVLRYVVAEDCGPQINPMLVEGQTHGGLAQGVGEALLEEMAHDGSGQPLAVTFMDYLLPTVHEVPAAEIVHLETPSPNTARGVKGMGESATIGAPACLANAVADAVGREVDELPVTPARVLRRLGCPVSEGC
ncbi:MAG: xanthine dehydrogenase family protein molybdopterin-binding subunit [Armatimonadota bacterium]|nr:xanthine dehydrogenase family protein molybdopterin-binding subunit [Armatimonadota bacterium]MDR7497836.1 xanthine dehydrogenase family protein molybdopterin-binding subunit [Armatimonadota bacterium]MDR7512385.1 xanthine dehydrogenase family protein molybdopterin-binding subunit [Armatimonadota bacterium]